MQDKKKIISMTCINSDFSAIGIEMEVQQTRSLQLHLKCSLSAHSRISPPFSSVRPDICEFRYFKLQGIEIQKYKLCCVPKVAGQFTTLKYCYFYIMDNKITPQSKAKTAKQKRNRSLLSCTECHRRKQKCSRAYPCDDCVERGVSYKCKFEASV